jgi:ABC-2 type transport system ATP-binding protein
MDNILEIKNLTKTYKGFTLDNINLTLSPGSILGIIGPNGAGKTTTLKILMGITRANSGTVSIFGMNHKNNSMPIKNKIGYVGEDQFFYENKTVSWTSQFVQKFYDHWDTNLFQSLLTDFEISRSKKIRELSKGMRVKLGMAIALSHNPDLLILDEPTAGLDPIIRRELLDILHDIPGDKNKSVIISSHITDDIARIADFVLFIVEGKIVLAEEKDELFSHWKRIHYKKGTIDSEIMKTLTNCEEHMFGSSGITDNYPGIKGKLAEGLSKENVKIENVTLDDILISFVKEK